MKVDCLGVVAGGFIGICLEVKRAAFSKGLGVEAQEKGENEGLILFTWSTGGMVVVFLKCGIAGEE